MQQQKLLIVRRSLDRSHAFLEFGETIVEKSPLAYDVSMIDRRFPTALHVMASLVQMEDQGEPWVSSSLFAYHLNINPTQIRRLLTSLVQHGLLKSKIGRNGGVRLARRAEDITLKQIYQGSVGDKMIWTSKTDIPGRCSVTRNFATYFTELEFSAEHVLAEMLSERTLKDSYDKLLSLDQEHFPALSKQV